MDVVVPYARSMDDLFEVLNVLVADDPETRGDFWRVQNAVSLPKSSNVRPPDYNSLRNQHALKRKRIGVPRMYINKDPLGRRLIVTRASVIELWNKAARDLAALGAEVVEVDFPVVANYERGQTGAESMADRGLVPREFAKAEEDLWIFGWDDFLQANGDPDLHSLADVKGELIVPRIPGAIADHYQGIPSISKMAECAQRGLLAPNEIPYLAGGLRGLEETRRRDLEEWMNADRLDAVVFPAVADVAPADADYNQSSNEIAWRNGIWVANGNQCIRHLGIPTVTVPMGLMKDIRMPIGLTFLGNAYDDNNLLRYAYAFEQSGSRRVAPTRTLTLPGEEQERIAAPPASQSADGPKLAVRALVSPAADDGTVTIAVDGFASTPGGIAQVAVFVNGESVPIDIKGELFSAKVTLPLDVHCALHSRWRGPYGSIVAAIARDTTGACSGEFVVVGGIA
jgi:amidase